MRTLPFRMGRVAFNEEQALCTTPHRVEAPEPRRQRTTSPRGTGKKKPIGQNSIPAPNVELL